MTETPFKISIPDEKLKLLRAKLELTTFPDELADAGWEYGVPLADVRRLVNRWMNGYDWKKHESQLNSELPQFTRDIEVEGHGTLTIHYVHKKSDIAQAVPLLFVHGWPGSFLEGRKLLPLLTMGTDDFPAFHVVILSLPGYGFSEGAHTKGFGIAQYAEVGNKLMLTLGYSEYGIIKLRREEIGGIRFGGSIYFHPVTRKIAKLYGGKHSKAWHTNLLMGEEPETTQESLTDKEKAGLERNALFRQRGFGYFHQQSTQPQTLGYSLADSPAGLLAWIYEKLVNWTDAYPWEDDEASVRTYFEAVAENVFSLQDPPTIPLGLSQFPKDALVFPKSWTRGMGNIVFEEEHDSGGHFAGYERPAYLANDLRKMFGKDGPAYGIVPGKSGYA
ncbi:Alpha/Beta hydrolase protein [Mycena capillaripes]|nr:Alpha/Beta hydrolase protein [Mycena capillaripes]